MLVSLRGPVTPITLEKSLCSLVCSVTVLFQTPYLPAAAIFMIAVSPSAYGYVKGQAFKAQYATILGPFFLTILLMFVSGLTLQERPGAKKRYEAGNHWEEYARWLHQTSILIPFPPQLYAPLPTVIKRTVFLEFPIYVFDPAKHADQSKVRDREAEEGRQAGQPSSNDEGN